MLWVTLNRPTFPTYMCRDIKKYIKKFVKSYCIILEIKELCSIYFIFFVKILIICEHSTHSMEGTAQTKAEDLHVFE